MTNIELKKLILEKGKKHDPNWEESVYKKGTSLRVLLNDFHTMEEREIPMEEIVDCLVDLAEASYLKGEKCNQYHYELMLEGREDINDKVMMVLSKSSLIKDLKERLEELRKE